MSSVGVALVAALTLAFAVAAASAAGAELKATGSMLGEHQQPLAAALPGGKVLIAGGNVWQNPQEPEPYPTPKAEVFDLGTGAFTETGQMLKGRYAGAAATLANGEVLIAGGLYAPDFGAALASAELYDPVTGDFSSTGSLAGPRWNLFAVTLADGRVLVGDGQRSVTGGTEVTATTELYDPVGGTFSAGPTLPTARLEPAAALLPDGRVLIAGGYGNGQLLASSEILDPCTGASTPGPEMLASGIARATSLTNGRVLISTRNGGVSELEEYDPVADKFIATGISSGSIKGAALAPLSGGRALIAGRVGSANESTAARQAYIFSGVEAAGAAAPPTCAGSEPAPPVDSPIVPTPPLTPPLTQPSAPAATTPAPTSPAPAGAVSAARAESKRHRHHARRHHKRRHHTHRRGHHRRHHHGHHHRVM